MAINGITTVTFDCYGTLIDWEGGIGVVPLRDRAAAW